MFLDIFSSHLVVVSPVDAARSECCGLGHLFRSVPRSEDGVSGDVDGKSRLERPDGTEVTLDSLLQKRDAAAASGQEDVLWGESRLYYNAVELICFNSYG